MLLVADVDMPERVKKRVGTFGHVGLLACPAIISASGELASFRFVQFLTVSVFNGFKPCPNVSPECLNLLVAFTKQSETFANCFSCGLVNARLDLVIDESFKLRRK